MKRMYDKLTDKLLLFQEYLETINQGFSHFVAFEVSRTLLAHGNEITQRTYTLKDLMEVFKIATKGAREIYQVYALIDIISKIIEGQISSVDIQRTTIQRLPKEDLIDFDEGNNFNGFASSFILSKDYEQMLKKILESWNDLTIELKNEMETLLYKNYKIK